MGYEVGRSKIVLVPGRCGKYICLHYLPKGLGKACAMWRKEWPIVVSPDQCLLLLSGCPKKAEPALFENRLRCSSQKQQEMHGSVALPVLVRNRKYSTENNVLRQSLQLCL